MIVRLGLVILSLVCNAAIAQDCSKLTRLDSVVVLPDEEITALAEEQATQAIAHYTRLLNEPGCKFFRKRSLGHETRIRSPFQREDNWGEPDSFDIYPVLDSGRLYLSGGHTTHMGCKLGTTKSYYLVKFADGVTYKYEEPYLTEYEFDDLFMLLQGKVKQMRYTGGVKQEVSKAAGDEILLKKMLLTPIVSIQEYSADDRTMFGIPKDGKLFDEFEPGRELMIPAADAVKLMQSLQCLVMQQG